MTVTLHQEDNERKPTRSLFSLTCMIKYEANVPNSIVYYAFDCVIQYAHRSTLTYRSEMTKSSQNIRPVCLEPMLEVWKQLVSIATSQAQNKNPEQSGRVSSLVRVFAGRKVKLLVLSYTGLFHFRHSRYK